jgi:hypothetical protein
LGEAAPARMSSAPPDGRGHPGAVAVTPGPLRRHRGQFPVLTGPAPGDGQAQRAACAARWSLRRPQGQWHARQGTYLGAAPPAPS